MRTVACAALVLLLLSLPGGQAQAQIAPDGPARADVSRSTEGAARGEPRGSAPNLPAVLLWQPTVENRAMTSEAPTFEAPPMPAWSDWSTEKKAWVIGGGVLALIILGVVSIG